LNRFACSGLRMPATVVSLSLFNSSIFLRRSSASRSRTPWRASSCFLKASVTFSTWSSVSFNSLWTDFWWSRTTAFICMMPETDGCAAAEDAASIPTATAVRNGLNRRMVDLRDQGIRRMEIHGLEIDGRMVPGNGPCREEVGTRLPHLWLFLLSNTVQMGLGPQEQASVGDRGRGHKIESPAL